MPSGRRAAGEPARLLQVYVARLRKVPGRRCIASTQGGACSSSSWRARPAGVAPRPGRARRVRAGSGCRYRRGARALARLAAGRLDEPPFGTAARAGLEEQRLGALEERIDADLALGRHADLIHELDALVAEHPYRERFRGQQMAALYRSGLRRRAPPTGPPTPGVGRRPRDRARRRAEDTRTAGARPRPRNRSLGPAPRHRGGSPPGAPPPDPRVALLSLVGAAVAGFLLRSRPRSRSSRTGSRSSTRRRTTS